MRIARVDVTPFEPPFSGGGYAMSHVLQVTLHARMIRLVTSTGAFGVGEIVRRPKVDPVGVVPLEDHELGRLSGAELADLPMLIAEWRARHEQLEGLAYAVELAMFDMLARQAEIPLSAFLGGPAGGEVGAYLSISSGAPEDMAKAVRARPGHPVVQAKLGIDTVEMDMRRVCAVLAAMAPDQKLLADFNGALDRATALTALPEIEDPRLTWEDPCLTMDDNTAVARALRMPVMFDMCMSSIGAFQRALADGVAGSLVIKPPFLGGLSVARTAREMCVAAGVSFRIDGPWSGPVAAAANIHLALGAPADLLICSADLTDPFDFETAMITTPRPGFISLPGGPGVGPVPGSLLGDGA